MFTTGAKRWLLLGIALALTVAGACAEPRAGTSRSLASKSGSCAGAAMRGGLRRPRARLSTFSSCGRLTASASRCPGERSSTRPGFDGAGFNILDAKVHTTRAGYALDTFQVTNPLLEYSRDGAPAGQYRDFISLVETDLVLALAFEGALPEPSRGRMSRRVKSFPVSPRVTLTPDDRAQHWLLGVSASDRSGLLYAIARVLARHHINLQLAKISTLGERVEDTFLIDGAALSHNRTQIAIETELLDAIAA